LHPGAYQELIDKLEEGITIISGVDYR
jgi:hypothetical protein